MNTEKVTRVEIIDHRPCYFCDGHGQLQNGNECTDCNGLGCAGRTVVARNEDISVEVDLQDEERTLKIFIREM